MVGSTARADGADPEDVRASLREFHSVLRNALEEHEATVEKFIGDAVVAVFGVPVTREDDAERAVRAALAIRDRLAGRDDFEVRVGLATGEALVDLRADVAGGENVAAGDVLNVGSRLAGAAEPGAVVVDERTYALTRGAFVSRPLGDLTLKGKAEPVPAWTVEGPRRRRDERGEAPLVGRREELDELRGALDRARVGEPQLVTVVGVPGIGKSRLVAELRDRSEPTLAWLQGRSLPYGEETPFWALGEIVKTFAGILRTDGPEQTVDKLRRALPRGLSEAEAEWIEAQVSPLVGLTAAAGPRDERFAAWRRLLEAIAEERPLVLVFEDLHWAGEGLLAFVDDLVAWTTESRLLVLCTARPELLDRHPGWGTAFPHASTLHLEPLGERETIEVVAAAIDRALLPEHVEAAVVARAEGNPLYAQEYGRMLADRGLLDEASTLPLPESVQAVIAARMDTLPADEKALVHDAAVVGRTSWVGALAALGGLPRFAVEERLQALERKEFLGREPGSSIPGETSYSFGHVLVRDVAYGQIPRGARAEKHRRAAEWLETMTSSREDLAELIAHHYQCALDLSRAAGVAAGDLPERARRALRDAGERAVRLNAHPAAARFFASALELWPEDDPTRPYLLLAYGRSLSHAEQAGAEELEAARDGLTERGDRAAAAEADVELADLLRLQGHHEDSYAALQRAYDLLAAEPPSRTKAQVLSKLSGFLMFADRHEEAIRVGFEALQMADELELPDVRASALTNVGVSRTALGDRGGIVDLERSIEISVAANSREAVRGYVNLASMVASLGDLRRAAELYEEGRTLAHRFGDTRGILWFTGESVYVSYWSKHWEEALATVEEVLADRRVLPHTRFDARLVRSWIRLARGDLDGALEDAEALLGFVEGDEPQFAVPALALRARVLVAAGRTEEARHDGLAALERWTAERSVPSFWLADLAVALCAVGEGDVLAERLASLTTPNAWVDAARAYAEGEFGKAARVYEQIGAEPEAEHALARAEA